MKIRRGYGRSDLKTERVKLKLIGGEEDYTAYCAGYCAGANYLTPSRKFKSYNTEANIHNVESITYFNSIGAGLALTTSGQIYKWSYVSVGTPFAYSGMAGSVIRSTFEYFNQDKPAVVVVSGNRMTFLTDEKYEYKALGFYLKGACYHYGRMFAADVRNPYVFRWTGTSLTDWAQTQGGAGYIKLTPERGLLYRTVAFGDQLVIYREYGLDVIKAFGDSRHFSVVQQGCKNVMEKLVEDAIAVCDGKIYFCSYDKIYTYDGEKIETLKIPDYMKAHDYTLGKAYDDRFVHFYCTPDNGLEKCQFEIDTEKGTCSFFAPGMKFLWKSKDGFWAWKDNVVYLENKLGYDMPCVWRSKSVDLGRSDVKTLKSVYLKQTQDAVLKVTADGVSREFCGNGRVPVDMSGTEFAFEVRGRGDTLDVEAEWEVRL